MRGESANLGLTPEDSLGQPKNEALRGPQHPIGSFPGRRHPLDADFTPSARSVKQNDTV